MGLNGGRRRRDPTVGETKGRGRRTHGLGAGGTEGTRRLGRDKASLPCCRQSKVAHRKNFRTVKKFTNFKYKKYNEMLVSKSRTQKSKLNTKQVETHLSTVIIQ